MIPITVIIPTKDEEAAIELCLRPLVGKFHQVVVLDSDSADATKRLAAERGAEVVNFTWNGRYPKKKQWALENIDARNEWILFVDADEIVTDELADELLRLASRGFDGMAAFDVPVAYVWQGRRLKYGQTVVKRALLRREASEFPDVGDLDAPGMGEQEGHYQPVVKGRIGRVEALLVHADPDPIGQWFARHNRYSDWEAFLRTKPEARAQIRRLRSRQGRLLDALPAKPLVIFAYNLIVRRGFLDGRAGLDYAIALAFYHWQINVKTRELARLSVEDSAI